MRHGNQSSIIHGCRNNDSIRKCRRIACLYGPRMHASQYEIVLCNRRVVFRHYTSGAVLRKGCLVVRWRAGPSRSHQGEDGEADITSFACTGGCRRTGRDCSGRLLLVCTLSTLRAPLDSLGWCPLLHNRCQTLVWPYACVLCMITATSTLMQ